MDANLILQKQFCQVELGLNPFSKMVSQQGLLSLLCHLLSSHYQTIHKYLVSYFKIREYVGDLTLMTKL